MKIKVSGHSINEGTREFDILAREELQDIIDDLSSTEIYRLTFEEAKSYGHTGTAYSYIDARSGEIKTCWLGSGTTNHPWDSFCEIWLCSLETGNGAQDFGVEDLIDTDSAEYEEYRDSEFPVEEFIIREHGESELADRIENAITWYAIEFHFDDENIEQQLNDLYA